MSAFTKNILGHNRPSVDNSKITLEEYMDASEKGIQSLNDAEGIDGELNQIYQVEKKIDEPLPKEEEEQEEGIYIQPEETPPDELKEILRMAHELSGKEGYNLEVMPSLEAMSLERTKEVIRLFLETTRRLIVKLWRVVDDYWEAYLLRLTGLIQVSRRLIDEITLVEGKTLSSKVLKSDKYNYQSTFHVNGTPIKDYNSIDSAFKALIDEGGGVLNQWSTSVVRNGMIVVDLLENANPNNIDEDLMKCNQITQTMFEGMPSKLREGITFMSGVKLTYTQPEEPATGSSVSQQAMALMSNRFEVETVAEGPEEPITFTVFSLAEIRDLMDTVTILGEGLRDHVRNNRLPRLSTNSRNLMNQGIRRFRNLNGAGDDGEYITRVNLTYRYAYAYGQWVRSPSMPVSSILVTVARNIQSLCREMLALYK